jgi:tetratricopeptide (TPR) repeat protein
VLTVSGEPGIGKSALLADWRRRAAARGAVVLAGRAVAHGLALQPVLDALAGRLAETSEPDQPAGLPGPTASAWALTRRMFGRLDRALDSLPAAPGLALVIDDADEADDPTWAWLAHLRRRPTDHRLLVVVAVRDPVGVPADADAHLALAPLDLDAVAELVGADRAEELWRRGGGNPLLTTELARAEPGEELPASIRELVARRLRRTGAAAATLRAAAVLGPDVDLDLLAGVLGTPPVVVLDHLDAGLRHSFLAEARGGLRFRHDLVRAGVAAEAGATRRAWLHREAARLLHDRPGASPLELARHARAGGDPVLAAEGLAAGAELARARLDLAGAERLLDEAIELDDAAGHRIRRSRIRMARGDIDGADDDAQAAMVGDATGEALELRAWAARNRHDLESTVRLGTAAVRATTDATIRASSLIAVAFGHRGMGDLRAADAVLTEAALDAPPELGLPAWTGVLRVHQGRPREALEHLEPVLGADAGRGMQAFWVEHTLQMTAHAYGLLGRVDAALRTVDRLEAELERRGTTVRYAGVQHTYRSWLLRNLADPAAEELARTGLALADGQEIVAQCHLDVADCLLRSGRLAEASGELARAREGSGAHRFHNKWRFDQRLGLTEARLHLAGHDARAAQAAAAAVVAAAEERGDRRYAVLARLVLVAASAHAGEAYDAGRLDRDLDALAEVAAVEGWWLAADVADATGSEHARAVAGSLAALVAGESGARGAAFRAVVADRLT